MDDNRDLEIEIPWPVLVIAAVLVIGLLGWFFSPRGSDDRPILLLPDVKAMEDYRRSVSGWVDEMRVLDGEISAVLMSDSSDLIGSMQKAQTALNHAVSLAQEIDQAGAPSVFTSLRSELYNTSLAYVESARSAARWLSIPNAENQKAAADAQQAARARYDALLASKWLE